jgi:hypothetical protein
MAYGCPMGFDRRGVSFPPLHKGHVADKRDIVAGD